MAKKLIFEKGEDLLEMYSWSEGAGVPDVEEMIEGIEPKIEEKEEEDSGIRKVVKVKEYETEKYIIKIEEMVEEDVEKNVVTYHHRHTWIYSKSLLRRDYEEIEEALKEKGYNFKYCTPGQSYRNHGALFYWKGEKPEYFTWEFKGWVNYGRRVLDLVKLNAAEPEAGAWKFEPLKSTRKFQDERSWTGRCFNETRGCKIVKLPEIKDDLEEL